MRYIESLDTRLISGQWWGESGKKMDFWETSEIFQERKETVRNNKKKIPIILLADASLNDYSDDIYPEISKQGRWEQSRNKNIGCNSLSLGRCFFSIHVIIAFVRSDALFLHTHTFHRLHQSLPGESQVELFIENIAKNTTVILYVHQHCWKARTAPCLDDLQWQFLSLLSRQLLLCVFAERRHSCADDELCLSQDHSPVFALLICT